VWGVRVNEWVSVVTLLAATAVIVVRARGTRGAETGPPVPETDSEEVT
jgi:hypothetical protein